MRQEAIEQYNRALKSGQKYLKEAAGLGDILVVGINSDKSVKINKGDSRPIIPEDERAEMLCALEFIDYVVMFDDETPIKLIKALGPDVLVKGGDYKVEDIVGYKEVIASGGTVTTIPYVNGKSTTGIVNKILSL